MLLVIDNYDSFTWNLVQLLGKLGGEPAVVRNDALSVGQLLAEPPSRLVVSPGPCGPQDAGISIAAIQALAPLGIPILGVCLGHQSIGEAFGGTTVRARTLMHGKVDRIQHRGEGLFQDLPNPLPVTRYHSLVTDSETLPPVLEVMAWSGSASDRVQGDSASGALTSGAPEIQAVRHRTLPVWGLQFHPESLFSEHGETLLDRFLRIPPGSRVL
jgi:anthranilate synthase component II